MTFRLAVGLSVVGVTMTLIALVAGDHTFHVSWDAARSVLAGFDLAWMWAASPRLYREEVTCESRST